jgi:prepilin-type processing-associated H-X9-DG protein
VVSVIGTPVPLFYCPSRRPAVAYPNWIKMVVPPYYSMPFAVSNRTDYAINAGATIAPADLTDHRSWEDASPTFLQGVSINGSGVRGDLKDVRAKDVTDGLGKTYLVGEKSLPIRDYFTGQAYGDLFSIFIINGGDMDIGRVAVGTPIQDPGSDVARDDGNHGPVLFELGGNLFGSAHPVTCNFVFCDGSVHSISYNVSFATHSALASRAAGDTPDVKEY